MKKLILAILVVLTGLNNLEAKTKLERVEPMFWWVDMANPNLQLLIYGENIASTNPEINHPGVQVNAISKVENPNYLFIDLIVLPNTKPGTFNIDFKQGKKVKHTYNYELKARNTNPKLHKGFDASDAIYLLMPDRFANGNKSNDSTDDTLEKADRNNPNGRHGGDLEGVRKNLNYISDLGFTAIWLNPFLENNQPAFSYHGYAISNFYKVDSRHGTNAEFKNLVDEAHKKDLKIIMDMVFNHCGSGHWFYKDLPMQNWIHQHDEFTRSNFRALTISDPYASDADRKKMLTGWFDTNMPDLNQRNPFLATYLIQNSIWWIEFSGIDGIRVDTQPYPYKDFMANWSKAIMQEYPDFNIVGEAWLNEIPNAAYWKSGANNADGYDSHMPTLVDFPLYNGIASAFNEDEGWDTGIAKLYYILAQDFVYDNAYELVTFTDNHDLNRIYASLDNDSRKLKMALAFLLTTRGTPQIYYGTELLMNGLEHQGHGFIRMDFPGGWENDTINAFTQEGRTADQNEVFDYLKTLLNWRKTQEAIHKGQLTHYVPEDGVYVYFRHYENKKVMVVLNNKEEEKTISTNRFQESIGGCTKGLDVISGEQVNDLNKLNLNAKSALVLELSK